MAAQEVAPDEERTLLVGVSIGIPAVAPRLIPEVFTIGVHRMRFRPGHLGPDLSIGIVPRALPDLWLVGARGGVALPLALTPTISLVPSGGVSLVGGIGSGGAAGDIGLNTGIAAAILSSGSVGLRAGVTLHRFRGAGNTVWLFELGLVRRQ